MGTCLYAIEKPVFVAELVYQVKRPGQDRGLPASCDITVSSNKILWVHMGFIKTEKGWSVHKVFPGDPVFVFAKKSRILSPRAERKKKVWPVFPQIYDHWHNGFYYRPAILSDLDPIISLVDRLLAGRDFFCPRGQHIGYFKYKTIVLCFDENKLIAWSVRQKNGSLIHLLVDPDYRGKGIGGHLLEVLQPLLIRSKSDQSTGDPYPFYLKHGYEKTTDERVGKNRNIDLLSKPASV